MPKQIAVVVLIRWEPLQAHLFYFFIFLGITQEKKVLVSNCNLLVFVSMKAIHKSKPKFSFPKQVCHHFFFFFGVLSLWCVILTFWKFLFLYIWKKIKNIWGWRQGLRILKFFCGNLLGIYWYRCISLWSVYICASVCMYLCKCVRVSVHKGHNRS